MAKVKVESLIGFELDRLEAKVQEFQKYLEINSIITSTKGLRLDEDALSLDAQDKLHKEIVIQIKMQDALFAWMPLLEKLREGAESKKLETRGDVEVSNHFKKKGNAE
jgi:hypothetical protein